MKVQTEPSRFRIDKAKADALISLTYGNPLRGCFFVAHASARLVGPEPVGELLNGDTDFFPFELHDAAGTRAVLLNRRHVITVALADNEAQRQPGYEVAPERAVSILLSNGDRVGGIVRVHRPAGRDRMSDWLRQPDVFQYLETETVTLLINVEHIVAIEEPASHG
jgi:hypothetical protein